LNGALMPLRPFWIKTDQSHSLGVGVTAYSEDDARTLFRLAWPSAYEIVEIKVIKDMRDIEQNHVVPNMEFWMKRGIWYPRGYTHI
jgi:hypothetical protein